MFAFVVVGFFILMIFSAEIFKMWRRETEYRRARTQWDDDVEDLRDQAWKGPGPGQRPATAPGYLAPAAARRTSAQPVTVTPVTATPVADVKTRIERELRALHQDVRTVKQRLKKEAAPEVYPYPVDMAVAHDDGGPDDEEVQTRRTH